MTDLACLIITVLLALCGLLILLLYRASGTVPVPKEPTYRIREVFAAYNDYSFEGIFYVIERRGLFRWKELGRRREEWEAEKALKNLVNELKVKHSPKVTTYYKSNGDLHKV